MHYGPLLFPMFMLGAVVSSILLPAFIELFKRLTMDNADRAERLLVNAEKKRIKAIRRSKVFKDRLKSILDLIKETSKEGTNRVTVIHMANCETDKEIHKFLNKRKFDAYVGYDGPNSMRIAWKDKRK